jgi:NAD(P)-dependent dehydrogenase (short-subunit alcohol dehydrogenase family)
VELQIKRTKYCDWFGRRSVNAEYLPGSSSRLPINASTISFRAPQCLAKKIYDAVSVMSNDSIGKGRDCQVIRRLEACTGGSTSGPTNINTTQPSLLCSQPVVAIKPFHTSSPAKAQVKLIRRAHPSTMQTSLAQVSAGFISNRHHDTYAYITPTTHAATDAHVIITGSSKGIGRATAISFAKSGASCIGIHSRRAADLSAVETEILTAAKTAGRATPTVVKLVGDLTSESDVADIAAQVSRDFKGRLDIVIQNAGYLEPWEPIAEARLDNWWRAWEVNIKGSFLVARALVPLLLEGGENSGNTGGGGTFVLITSGGALATTPGASAYQGTKTAQIRLAGFLQAEYGDKGLLAYSVHPGAVQTDLASGMPESAKAWILKEPDTPQLAGDMLAFVTREKREW